MRYGKLFTTIAAAVALAFALPVPVLADGPPASVETQPGLDVWIAQQMEEGGIVGVGAAIVVDRKVVWMQGYGHADQRARTPFTPDTVMNIGSISKTVTGVALMRAVQEGRVSLDADINGYLPFKVVNPHHPDTPITLRHLATHTSGLSDRTAVYRASYKYGDDKPEPLGLFLQGYVVPGGSHYAVENFLDARPGTHREYSNIGAGLAGYIVEQRSGQTLGDYARQKIFAPLGMRNTGWSLADVDRSRHSTLYVGQNGLSVPIPHYDVATYPDGGVRTSVADLSQLFVALLNNGERDGVRILDAGQAREMLRFQYTPGHTPANVDPKEKNSGLFWQSKFNVTRMGHGGTDPGVNTEMLSSLDRDIGVILFSNTSLAGEDSQYYVNIYQALWKRAEAMKAQAAGAKQGAG